MRWAIVFALATACGGCASITRGTTDQVQIQSEPPGAEVRTSMNQVCTTPCTLQFNRKDEFTVTASKPGYNAAEMDVHTRVAGGGAAGFAGNVLIGGVIGMAVDAADGATLEHYPNPVMLNLVPLRKGQAPRVIKQEPALPTPSPPPPADGPPQS
jgi:PEGA domain